MLGVAVVGEGSIKGFARDNILVNQLHILTVGGGDVLLWSSEDGHRPQPLLSQILAGAAQATAS